MRALGLSCAVWALSAGPLFGGLADADLPTCAATYFAFVDAAGNARMRTPEGTLRPFARIGGDVKRLVLKSPDGWTAVRSGDEVEVRSPDAGDPLVFRYSGGVLKSLVRKGRTHRFRYRHSVVYAEEDAHDLWPKKAEVDPEAVVLRQLTGRICYNTGMRGICTDNPGIENLISKGLVYVDKTDALFALIADPAASQYFLSRPRRFGKSLMIATLREIFKGRRDLFKDTFIGRSDYDWPVYPVIHLDLSKVVASTPEMLEQRLEDIVSNLAKDFGAPFDRSIPSGDNFENLIRFVAESDEKKQVVVLIDEYDAPVNGFIDNPEKLMAFRDVMHQFFLVLKANVERIRFLMATGVTRFTKISLFSCLNNPTDLSMDRRAARLCGYTPEEIEANFHEHIQAFADEKGITYEAMFGELLAWYDSYRFSPEANVRVCNPVSLGKALVNRVLMNYWESTGLASAAVMRVKANRRIISDWNGIEVERTSLDTSDMGNIPLETLLYQTGYLTIQNAFDDGVISLKVPNYEVLDSINQGAMSQWVGDRAQESIVSAKKTRRELLAKGMDFILEKSLTSCYARIPHEWVCKDEAEAKRFFQLYCHFLGAKVKGEHETHLGRADAVLELPNGVYLFEFKYEKSSAEALDQIKARGYADAYRDDPRPVWLIGCNYNPATRNLDRPAIERMSAN